MNTKTCLSVSLCVWIAAHSSSLAATIPSGTTLMVRTIESISSHQRVGRTFKAEIAHDVTVKGDVVLRAGTSVSGVVETAVGDIRRSNALKLNLTDVSINGHAVPVKTTGGCEPQPPNIQKTRRGATVYLRDYTFPRGTTLVFQLARPLNM